MRRKEKKKQGEADHDGIRKKQEVGRAKRDDKIKERYS